ncbi:alpha/beta fold hydrolase [Prochlorococcus sp. MIT 1300]|uniref:alpha/beta fold hydrolase n=1 Tax=Prochlorococcus sp. MIT 1300 TaxID=3096218 RepID=UPI002A75D2C8|nr:alpha/beta fold hydrolase [Prochlorococcus sp. MIT 1300]
MNSTSPAVLLVHGFGACKEHWRHNQNILSAHADCYAIDLIGFGNSSQPRALLQGEEFQESGFYYNFDNWGSQVTDFCKEVIKKPVILVGNSIGGIVSLRAAQMLKGLCCGVILIDCATRAMDDKRLPGKPLWMSWSRPTLKFLVKQRWLSSNLFRNAAQSSVVKKVLRQAYPSGRNVNESLVSILLNPSKRPGASESFRGFINLFDDHLAPQLIKNLDIPIDLIWGEEDPWEPIQEAKRWHSSMQSIRSLEIIPNAGHCPHDEMPEEVNPLLVKIIQAAK